MSSDLLEPWVKPCGFLAREQPDLAVLDVNLHGHPVIAVAKRQKSRRAVAKGDNKTVIFDCPL